MKIYEISFMYDGTYYVRNIASKKDVRTEEDAFDVVEERYPSFSRAKEHKLLGIKKLAHTESELNSKWDSYDQTVAKGHLMNFGMVFVDEQYGDPIDNDHQVEEYFKLVA